MAMSPAELVKELTHTEIERLSDGIFGKYNCSFNVASVTRKGNKTLVEVELDNKSKKKVRVQL